MNLRVKDKEIELVYTTRKIVNMTKNTTDKNLETYYFKAMNEKDVEALATIIYTFAENIEDGAKAFKDINQVYEFIDDYMKENNIGYEKIYEIIAESINDEGFFNTKMSKEELEEKSKTALTLDMNTLIENSVKEVLSKEISTMLEQETQQKKFLNSKA